MTRGKPRFIETRHRRGYQFVASSGHDRAECRTSAGAHADISAIAVLHLRT